MAASRQEGVTEEDLPSELQGRLTTFDNALSKIEEVLDPLHSVPLSEIHAKVDALDKAKLDLIGVYAVNSLFWMYLNVKGEKPKDHHVKTELDRIRGYMNRVKEIQEKQKAPKIDKDASKRFVHSALWQMAHKKAQEGAASTSAAAENSPQSSSSKSGQQSVITVSSQSQNSDSDSEESPAKKQKTGKKNRKKRKNKKK